MFLTRFPIIASTFSTVFSLSTGIFRYVLPSRSSFFNNSWYQLFCSFRIAEGSDQSRYETESVLDQLFRLHLLIRLQGTFLTWRSLWIAKRQWKMYSLWLGIWLRTWDHDNPDYAETGLDLSGYSEPVINDNKFIYLPYYVKQQHCKKHTTNVR